MSKTIAEVRAANGISSISALALSVAGSTASRSPMMWIVVEAKNDGLVDRFCTTTPSTTQLLRQVVCNIQRARSRLVSASNEGRTAARRLAQVA